uniref:Uncharacterized protein n=1 Tax=Oryza nivara TaxID=4536 RepID=A0A0E0IB23_ORYNI
MQRREHAGGGGSDDDDHYRCDDDTTLPAVLGDRGGRRAAALPSPPPTASEWDSGRPDRYGGDRRSGARTGVACVRVRKRLGRMGAEGHTGRCCSGTQCQADVIAKLGRRTVRHGIVSSTWRAPGAREAARRLHDAANGEDSGDEFNDDEGAQDFGRLATSANSGSGSAWLAAHQIGSAVRRSSITKRAKKLVTKKLEDPEAARAAISFQVLGARQHFGVDLAQGLIVGEHLPCLGCRDVQVDLTLQALHLPSCCCCCSQLQSPTE